MDNDYDYDYDNNKYECNYEWDSEYDVLNNILETTTEEPLTYNKKDSEILFNQKPKIELMQKEDLFNERDKIINEGMDYLYMTQDEATIVLIYYKWKFDRLSTIWYDNVEKNRELCGLSLSKDTLNQLDQKKVISNSNYCLVCSKSSKDNENNSYDSYEDQIESLECHHQFCRECWKEYLNEKTRSSNDILALTCPQKGCTIKVYNSLYEKYLTYENMALYTIAVLDDFVSHSDDIKTCPNQSCLLYTKLYNQSNKEIDIKCSCGTSFCFKCGQKSHQPCSCYLSSKLIKNKQQRDYLYIISNNNYRLCPICNQAIEKYDNSSNCVYMKCIKKYRGCGTVFCFECEAPWATHDSNIHTCTKRKFEIEYNAVKRKNMSKVYESFGPYYNNEEMLCYGRIEELEQIQSIKFISKELVLLKEISLLDLNYIINSLADLLKVYRVLMNSYVLCFYLLDKDAIEYLKSNQMVLKEELDKTNKYINYSSISSLLNITTINEFQKKSNCLKDKIINEIPLLIKYADRIVKAKKLYSLDNINLDLLENGLFK